jgi:hypothetical protein
MPPVFSAPPQKCSSTSVGFLQKPPNSTVVPSNPASHRSSSPLVLLHQFGSILHQYQPPSPLHLTAHIARKKTTMHSMQ